jgi:hypothetical protein
LFVTPAVYTYIARDRRRMAVREDAAEVVESSKPGLPKAAE